MPLVNSIKLLIPAFAACAFLISGNASATPLLPSGNELIELRKRVEELENKADSAQRANIFNPSITAFGNVMACFGGPSTAAKPLKGDSACANQIFFREFELDFRASIDPYADAVVIVGMHQHDGEFGVDVEEAYALFKPGFQLKVGRFLSSFGRMNRVHTHDLPQMTRPASALNFLGDHGLVQNGVSAQFLLPSVGDSDALTLNAEVLFSERSLPLAGNNDLVKLMGRLSWYFDLGDGHDLDLGGSALFQPRSAGEPFQLYGADFNYRWRPSILGDKRSFLVGGEMFVVNGASARLHDAFPIGGFAWTQLQLNQNAYLGLRYSYDQGITKDNPLNTTAGVFFTYYTTEFLRFRVGYERVSNDVAFKTGQDQFLFEMNFVFGSHPSEPYWVNR
jgi:hypothetical protein